MGGQWAVGSGQWGGLVRPVLLAVAVSSCGGISGPEYGGGEFDLEIRSGGVKRSYLVHVPATLGPNDAAPILFGFHGSGQTAEGFRDLTNLNTEADRLGFIAVYPRAFEPTGAIWAVGGGEEVDIEGIDDVGFTADLIDNVASHLSVDRNRVFAAGLSNGALMTHRLACDLSNGITAIASVGGTMVERIADACNPAREISVIFVHGTEDVFFPWDGFQSFNDFVLGVDDTMARWATFNGCSLTPDIVALEDVADDQTTVERRTYGGCDGGSEVVLYAVNGGGHTWPGSPARAPGSVLGRTSQDIDASAVIADFFARQ